MTHRKKIRRTALLALVLACCLATVALAAPVSLRQGSSGEVVRQMQQKLKNWGYYNGSVDGIFGSATAAAVRYFQRQNGLTPDGVVGPATAAALGLTLENSGSGSDSNRGEDSRDVYLMAKAIYGEARGEPYTGKVAVGAVILNRVKSANFPNTISGVIYQPGAFTAVSDGQINLTPDAEALRAARDAMNGWDPTGGCLYYYNPAKTTNSWIYSRKVVTVIGNHRFAV